jgi:hypothetical protein
MKSLLITLLMTLTASHALAGVIPKREVPKLPDGSVPALCTGKVFSIYGMGNGAGSDQELVDIISDDGNYIAAFLVGTNGTDDVARMSMLTLLNSALVAQSRVLLSYVTVDKDVFVTGVYVPPEHYDLSTSTQCRPPVKRAGK